MASYYADAVNGNNNNAGTQAAPKKTISAANALASAGDDVIVLAGTYNEKVNGKTDVTYKASPARSVTIDAENIRDFCFFAGSQRDVRIEGFNTKRATSACIGFNYTYGIRVINNSVDTCNGNGIYVGNGDDILIENNDVIKASMGSSSGVSGISILAPENSGRGTIDGTYRIIIRGNRVRDCVATSGAKSDSNGIICDKFQYWSGSIYNGLTLVEYNLIYGNGGAGFRAMASTGITCQFNTAYGDMQDQRLSESGNTWGAEIHNQYSWGNKYLYNIGFATDNTFNTHGFQNNYSKGYNNGSDGSLNGNLYLGNIFTGPNGRNATSSSGLDRPSANDNMLGVDPMFTNPAQGDFSLKPGSPALNAGPNGKNIGYWQDDVVTPPEPVVKLTDPVLTIANPYSGEPFSLALGSYSGAVTRNHKPQLYYDNKWNDVVVPLNGTNPLTGLNPDVAATVGYSILEEYTVDGVTKKVRSNWIDISPVPVVVNAPPECTTDPVVTGTASVDSTLTTSLGSWGGTPVPDLTAKWQRNGVDIAGATSINYKLVAADSGTNVRSAVQGANIEGSVTAYSAAIGPITATTPADTIENLTIRVGNLEARVGALEADLAAFKAASEQRDASLQAQIDALTSRVSAEETKIDPAIQEMKDAISNMESSISSLTDELAALKDLTGGSADATTKLSQQVEALTMQLDGLNTNLENIKQMLETGSLGPWVPRL